MRLWTKRYVYDDDGGRVRKTRDEGSTALTTDGGGTIKTTTYIGSLYEVESGGKTSKHIFAGVTKVCSITKDEGRGTKDESYYHSDHLGSSSIITDASGSKVEHYEYTPYGSIAVQELVSRPSPLVHHLFTGKEIDSTGLYFYGARYYDPEIGRFISADTIVQSPYDPQSLNRYSYVRNNPINYIDPTGHFWAELIWSIVAIAVGYGLDKAGVDVNVEAGVTIPFGPGGNNQPSGSPSTGSPGQTTSIPQTNTTPISQNLPTPSEIITSDTQAINDNLLNTNYEGIEGERIGWWKQSWQETKSELDRDDSNLRKIVDQVTDSIGSVKFVGKGGVKHLHHLLPTKFKLFFERAGLNIEKYKKALSIDQHILKPDGIHTNAGGNWNKVWEKFKDQFPDANRHQIIDQLKNMMRKFKL